MKALIAGIIALTVAAVVMAQDSSPYSPELAKKLGQVETKRVAKVVYDVAVNGGSVGTIGLGVTLPAKSLITQSWYRVQQQFTDSGAGSVGISCEDANNIINAADITGFTAGTIGTGVQTGVATAMTDDIAAACEIRAVVTGAAQTAGKLNIWVEYVAHD